QSRTHARQDLLAHLKDKDARLALQSTPPESVVQEIGHLRRKLYPACARADDGKGRGGTRILRRSIRWDAVERINHAIAQSIRIGDAAEREGMLFRALDARVVGHAAHSDNEHIVSLRLSPTGNRRRACFEINVCDF